MTEVVKRLLAGVVVSALLLLVLGLGTLLLPLISIYMLGKWYRGLA